LKRARHCGDPHLRSCASRACVPLSVKPKQLSMIRTLSDIYVTSLFRYKVSFLTSSGLFSPLLVFSSLGHAYSVSFKEPFKIFSSRQYTPVKMLMSFILTFITQCASAWSWMGLPFPGDQTRMSLLRVSAASKDLVGAGCGPGYSSRCLYPPGSGCTPCCCRPKHTPSSAARMNRIVS